MLSAARLPHSWVTSPASSSPSRHRSLQPGTSWKGHRAGTLPEAARAGELGLSDVSTATRGSAGFLALLPGALVYLQSQVQGRSLPRTKPSLHTPRSSPSQATRVQLCPWMAVPKSSPLCSSAASEPLGRVFGVPGSLRPRLPPCWPLPLPAHPLSHSRPHVPGQRPGSRGASPPFSVVPCG